MDVVKLTANTDEDGCLNLKIPTQMAGTKVNVVIVVNPVSSVEPPQRNYDFSDLVGQLVWRGDAVTVQRDLRDEW